MKREDAPEQESQSIRGTRRDHRRVRRAAGFGLCRDKVGKAIKFQHDKESLRHRQVELIGSGSGNDVVLHLTFPDYMHCLNA
jgi:hypothetical protein